MAASASVTIARSRELARDVVRFIFGLEVVVGALI
jgi:hypothetical protein